MPGLISTGLTDITEEELVEQDFKEELARESTVRDYWDFMNPLALKGTRPGLQTSREDYFGEDLNVEDETFKQLISISNPETQEAMYGAVSTEHAYKMYAARAIQQEASTRINNDALVTQVIMGALPAIVSPTSILPIGGVASTVLRVGKGVSRIATGVRAAGAGAIGGAVANAGDEYIIGGQDLHMEPMSAFAMGAAFGGSIGFFGGLIAGPLGKANAMNLSGSSDTYKADFHTDPDIIWSVNDPSGVPRMSLAPQGVQGTKTTMKAAGSTSTERQSKMLIDRVPIISDLLNSDVSKAYMHESAVGRAIMTKLVLPTTALYDKIGNAIAIGKTALDVKISRRGTNTNLKNDLEIAYIGGVKAGAKGGRKSFKQAVNDVYHAATRKQESDLSTAVNSELNKFDNTYGDSRTRFLDDEAKAANAKGKAARQYDVDELNIKAEAHRLKQRRKLVEKTKEDFYANNKVEFESKSPFIKAGAEAYRKFYQDHIDFNKKLDMEGTRKTNRNKLYVPKLMDWDKFKQEAGFLAKFEEDAYQAFKKHPGNADLTDAELRLLSKEYREVVETVEYRQNFTHGSFLAPTLSGDARMKGRKFQLDEEIMGKYRILDMEDVSSRYQYQMSGRQAVQFAFGTTDVASIMSKARADMIAEGISHESLVEMSKYIENSILDLSGQLRMNALSGEPMWQITRTLQQYNSARLGAGFGGNQLIELVGNIFLNHAPSMLKGRFFKSFSNVGKGFYTKPGQFDDFSKTLINMGFLEDVTHTNKVNRYADTEAGWDSGIIEKGLQGFTDKLYKWNGMRYFKGVMEDMTGGALMLDIPRLASKTHLTGAELARISRWGLDPTTLRELAADIDMNYRPGEGVFDYKNFTHANKERFELAVQRGISETVIQGDSLHLPTWMKVPTPFRVLLFQFMRFPLIAHSTLLRQGLSEGKARMGAAVISSSMTFLGIKYLREQAAISMGLMDDRDAKYDYFDKLNGAENLQRGIIASTNYIAPLGMMTTAISYGSNLTTGSEIGSDYRGTADLSSLGGVTFGSLAPTIMKLMQEPITNNMTDERTALKIKSLLPGQNLFVIDEGLKYLIQEGF